MSVWVWKHRIASLLNARDAVLLAHLIYMHLNSLLLLFSG